MDTVSHNCGGREGEGVGKKKLQKGPGRGNGENTPKGKGGTIKTKSAPKLGVKRQATGGDKGLKASSDCRRIGHHFCAHGEVNWERKKERRRKTEHRTPKKKK